ncbi:MAG: hypothetical protein [Namikivirus tsukuho]|uniref:Uncharacterized protein n=1 Tax=Bacteriophage sp. TaxID=38018 RepID=A0ABY5TRF7_9VIRU|nr:MAG: hypothetical protein [Bacteriophage sp.]
METINYLTTLARILTSQPKTAEILDEHGLGPETTFGCIGINDFNSFMQLYGLLNTIEDVKTTSINTIEENGYDFTVTSPITIRFFHLK